MSRNTDPIVVEPTLDAPVAAVWKAITDPAQELSETPAGTTLKLTHTGIESFPQDDPVFSREAGITGWPYFLQESLPAFLRRTSEARRE